jgi:hypothetical protein
MCYNPAETVNNSNKSPIHYRGTKDVFPWSKKARLEMQQFIPNSHIWAMPDYRNQPYRTDPDGGMPMPDRHREKKC